MPPLSSRNASGTLLHPDLPRGPRPPEWQYGSGAADLRPPSSISLPRSPFFRDFPRRGHVLGYLSRGLFSARRAIRPLVSQRHHWPSGLVCRFYAPHTLSPTGSPCLPTDQQPLCYGSNSQGYLGPLTQNLRMGVTRVTKQNKNKTNKKQEGDTQQYHAKGKEEWGRHGGRSTGTNNPHRFIPHRFIPGSGIHGSREHPPTVAPRDE